MCLRPLLPPNLGQSTTSATHIYENVISQDQVNAIKKLDDQVF